MKQYQYILKHNTLVYCWLLIVFISFICSGQQSWITQTSPTHCQLNGVVWGNNTFIAVGDSGKILSSPDGILWTIRNSGTTNSLRNVAWGAGKFVAIDTTNDVYPYQKCKNVVINVIGNKTDSYNTNVKDKYANSTVTGVAQAWHVVNINNKSVLSPCLSFMVEFKTEKGVYINRILNVPTLKKYFSKEY